MLVKMPSECRVKHLYQPLSALLIFVKFNHPSSVCSTGGGPLSITKNKKKKTDVNYFLTFK